MGGVCALLVALASVVLTMALVLYFFRPRVAYEIRVANAEMLKLYYGERAFALLPLSWPSEFVTKAA